MSADPTRFHPYFRRTHLLACPAVRCVSPECPAGDALTLLKRRGVRTALRLDSPPADRGSTEAWIVDVIVPFVEAWSPFASQ